MKGKKEQKNLRHARVRKNLRTNKKLPRLVVFRSNKYMYAQVIDDTTAKTIAAESDLGKKKTKAGNKMESATEIGTTLAQKAVKAKVKNVIFDRAGYKFHGRVKALAEGARKGGLIF